MRHAYDRKRPLPTLRKAEAKVGDSASSFQAPRCSQVPVFGLGLEGALAAGGTLAQDFSTSLSRPAQLPKFSTCRQEHSHRGVVGDRADRTVAD